MAYRRPGVTVTQEFVNVAPALAAFSLPSITVGPAYQLIDDDVLGVYAAAELLYPYAGMMGGAQADIEELAEDEVYPITKKPISAYLRNTKVEILGDQLTGAVAGDVFTDETTAQFADVLVGDILVVEAQTDIEIVAARTDGKSYMTSGLRNRLESTVSTQFTDVKEGDSVEVTGAAPSIAGTYVVTAKIGTNLLLLDGDINDGTADSTAVNYSITGDRGADNEGEYTVKTVTDENTLVLRSPMASTPEAPLKYTIKRGVGTVTLERVATVSEDGFVAAAEGITLPNLLTSDGLTILEGDLYASYRALRNDLASLVRQFIDVASLNSVFGVGQLLPANPLAYGLSVMLQNTVTPVHGLGLDEFAVSNEVLSYTASMDVLKRGDMYAIAPLSQSPVIHTMFKNHVDQLSQPERKQERIVIINSRMPEIQILVDESTTSTAVNGSRQIVTTKLTGSGVYATSPTTFIDPTTGVFLNVAKGDNVVVVAGGAGTIVGTYTVASKTDNNTVVFTAPFLSSGAPSDIQYYIYRKDGIAAGGASFYDRNGSFLTDGVSAGYYFTVLSGSLVGRYVISQVLSDKEITISPAIAAATTLVTAVNYQIDRDLSKPEKAEAVRQYSVSFSDRRVVHCWPDILKVPVGQSTYDVPGYYGCCTVAALTTGLPTQQGLTNLAVSGFLGFEHSTRYFTEEELDTIASGGTFIFAQDTESTPLYVRHQLTTDRSSIKFQEYSITKNVDYIAKFWRTTYAPFIGQYNIIDTTLDALKTTATSGLKFLVDNRIPRFGGVIRSGSLVSCEESTEAIDTVNVRISHNIPIPLNNIDIVIEV